MDRTIVKLFNKSYQQIYKQVAKKNMTGSEKLTLLTFILII